LESARLTTASTEAGRSSRSSSRDGGASCICLTMTSVGESPEKGTWPASISWTMMPSE
jgi:hypothetical protein